jgi:enterochelin esterase-like enzyme
VARALIPTRRDLLLTGAALAASAASGCGSCGDKAGSSGRSPASGRASASPIRPDEPGPWRALSWTPAEAPPEGQRALLFDPGARDAPVLVALHGRGEAGRGLDAGAAGWRDDYGLERAHRLLVEGAIDATALGGFAKEDRVAALRASLARRAYEGLAVVTPYTPVTPRELDGARPFAAFVKERLLAAVGRALGRAVEKARCGIDGVSMGGRLALQLAMLAPERFGAVGALQPALRTAEAEEVARALSAARARSPFALRLVSSDDDPFLDAVRALSAALDALKEPHGLVVTGGPHDYAWNRGPGAVELLAFHERILRGEPAP